MTDEITTLASGLEVTINRGEKMIILFQDGGFEGVSVSFIELEQIIKLVKRGCTNER